MKEDVYNEINVAPAIHEKIKLLKSIENHNFIYSEELDWVGWIPKTVRTKDEMINCVKKNGVPMVAYLNTGMTTRKLQYINVAYDNYEVNEGEVLFEQYGRKFSVDEKYINSVDVETNKICLDARVAKKMRVFEMEFQHQKEIVNVGSEALEEFCRKDLLQKMLDQERKLIKNKNPELEEKIGKAGCKIIKEDENSFIVRKKNFVAHIPKNINENKEQNIDGIVYSTGVLQTHYEKYNIATRKLKYMHVEADKIDLKTGDKNTAIITIDNVKHEIPKTRIEKLENKSLYLLESEVKKYNFETTGKTLIREDRNMSQNIKKALMDIQKEKEKKSELKRGA